MENALMRLIGEHPGGVAVQLVAWLVTGRLPGPAMRWDVVFVGRELPGI